MTASQARARAQDTSGLSLAAGDLAGLDVFDSDALALFCFADVRPLAGVAGFVDWRTCGALSRTIERETFRGNRGEVMLMPWNGRRGLRRFFVFGLGPRAACTGEIYREVVEQALAVMRQAGVPRPAVAAPAAKRFPEVEAEFLRATTDVLRQRASAVLVERLPEKS